MNDGSIRKQDGLTGQAYPAYTPDDSAYLDSQPTSTLVHTDGTIFAVQVSNENWKEGSVVGIWAFGVFLLHAVFWVWALLPDARSENGYRIGALLVLALLLFAGPMWILDVDIGKGA